MIDSWFPTGIYFHTLSPSEEVFTKMLEASNNILDTNLESNYAITGDTLNEYTLHNRQEFNWLNDQVSIHCKNYLTSLGCEVNDINLYAQKSWIVVSKKNNYGVNIHKHPNSVLSAVYYLQSEETSGDIEFYVNNPIQDMPIHTKTTSLSYKKSIYKPLVNRLLIFPSNVMHCVTANYSNINRISVTYDIVVTSNEKMSNVENVILDPSLWKKI